VPVSAMVLLDPAWVGGTISMLTRPLDHLPPTKTTVEIEPKGIRVVRGAPVAIQAATGGAIPASLDLITWTGTNERGEPIGMEKIPMEKLGAGKFSARVTHLANTLRYRVATGPFSSPTYTAEAVDPPEIANVHPLSAGLQRSWLRCRPRGQHRRAQRIDSPSRCRDHQRCRQS